MMKRFATPSKSSLIRHEFRKLNIGDQFSPVSLELSSGFSRSIVSAVIDYLVKTGAARPIDKNRRPFTYEKIAHDEIKDTASHGPSERVIVHRKANVLTPDAFQSTEAADLKAANEALRVQLKSKMDEILTTLSEIDNILDNMK